MNVNRSRALLVLATLLGAGRTCTAAERVFIYAGSQMNKAAELKYGKDAGAQYQTPLANYVLKGILERFPCMGSLTMGDASNLMSLEKMRLLLGGGEDYEKLAALGGAIGARYVVRLNWSMIGDQVSVTGVLYDIARGRALSRKNASFPNDADAVDNLVAFAQEFDEQLPLPECRDSYSGVIGVRLTFNKAEVISPAGTDGSRPVQTTYRTDMSFDGSIRLSEYPQNEPDCEYNYSFRFTRDSMSTGKVGVCSLTSRDAGTRTVAAAGTVRAGRMELRREGLKLRLVLTGIEGMEGNETEASSSSVSVSGPDCPGGNSASNPPRNRPFKERMGFDTTRLIPYRIDTDNISDSWSDEMNGVKRSFTVQLKRVWK